MSEGICPQGLKEVDDRSCRTCNHGKWGGDAERCLCEKYTWYDYWDSVCDDYEEMPEGALREDIEPPNLRSDAEVCGTCKHSKIDPDCAVCKCELFFGAFYPWTVCDKYEECEEDPNDGLN